MHPHLSRCHPNPAGNVRAPITVHPRTRRKCGHTHLGTSTKPQGMRANPSRYVHKTAGNMGTPILVHPRTRRECGHTHHGTSTNPQGMCAHPSWYVHKTAGNVGKPILVRPQTRRECGHTHHGTSTNPQGMRAHLCWYGHKPAGNVGTPILVRPNPSSDLGTPISDLRMQAGFGPFLRLHHRLLRKNEEPRTRNFECFIHHPSAFILFLPSSLASHSAHRLDRESTAWPALYPSKAAPLQSQNLL